VKQLLLSSANDNNGRSCVGDIELEEADYSWCISAHLTDYFLSDWRTFR